VRMTVNGAIQLTAEDPDLGEAQVIVPVVENNHEGDDLVTGFNLAYLRDAIPAKEETVELGLSAPGDALRVDSDGKVGVVMPMRL
jgi:DNA polymerase III sliding clamp (beta) subunit (PCNA family)